MTLQICKTSRRNWFVMKAPECYSNSRLFIDSVLVQYSESVTTLFSLKFCFKSELSIELTIIVSILWAETNIFSAEQNLENSQLTLTIQLEYYYIYCIFIYYIQSNSEDFLPALSQCRPPGTCGGDRAQLSLKNSLTEEGGMAAERNCLFKTHLNPLTFESNASVSRKSCDRERRGVQTQPPQWGFNPS